MVYLVKKQIKNKVYLYLVESARINGKVKRIWQKYLGPEDSIKSAAINLSNEPEDIRLYEIGLSIPLMKIAQKLDLISIIDRNTTKRSQGISVGEYILIAALNRCIKPVSKQKMLEWFKSSYLHTMFHHFETYLDSMAYTNHFAYLNQINIEKIEKEINTALKNNFDVNLNQLVYDTTNFFTYINPEDEDALPQHGHSKENRFTLNLVGMALLCTQDGAVPLLCDIYPGNVQDSHEFKWQIPKIIERIRSLNMKPEDIILTFDKGNHSEEVFAEIDKSNINFIASVRPSMTKQFASILAKDFTRIQLPNQKNVGILEYIEPFYNKNRRLIIVYNQEQAHWNGKNLTKKLEDEVSAIEEFFESRLNIKKWRNIEAVRTKVESLISVKDHKRFIQTSIQEDNGKISIDIHINKELLQDHIETLGKTYIITNNLHKSAEELVWLFRQQVTVERAFSYLKSPDLLHARPIFHYKDSSIQGHLFSCVIGLLLETLLLREVRKTYPEFSLAHLIEVLSTVNVVEIKYGGHQKPVRKLSHLSPDAEKLCDLLHISSCI